MEEGICQLGMGMVWGVPTPSKDWLYLAKGILGFLPRGDGEWGIKFPVTVVGRGQGSDLPAPWNPRPTESPPRNPLYIIYNIIYELKYKK